MKQTPASEREGNIAVLRGLLCFAERYETSLHAGEACPAKGMLSVYQNALRDAIDCMERQTVDPDTLCYLEERKTAMEKVQRREALKELLDENRRKGFPSEFNPITFFPLPVWVGILFFLLTFVKKIYSNNPNQDKKDCGFFHRFLAYIYIYLA